MPDRGVLTIDADALVHNGRVLRGMLPAGTGLGILVKANGYGHGLDVATRAAVAAGAVHLFVATVEEGVEVQALGVSTPVLVVYPTPSDLLGDAVAADLYVTIGSAENARETLTRWAAIRDAGGGTLLQVHLEVDTGMGRGGVPTGDLVRVLEAIDAEPGVRLAGIWSHLADGADAAVTAEQVARYDAALGVASDGGRPVPLRHLTATEGLFAGTGPGYDLVRIGLAFYGALGVGVQPAPEHAAAAASLRPALRLSAQAVRLETVPAGATVGYGGEWRAERDTLVATLPIGYADGWSRTSWPGTEAIVRGRRVPLIGRVSMDSVCADATDVAGLTPDDEFVLIGEDGGERITASEVARVRGSIPNEVFCAFGARLERRVVGATTGPDGVA